MQASILGSSSVLRPTAEPCRQRSIHLQRTRLAQAQAQAHGGVSSLAKSQFLHCKPAQQKSRARITPAAALAMEGVTTAAPLLAGAGAALLGALVLSLNRKKNNFPPGPSTLVFLTKFLNLRRSLFHVGPILRELHEQYGGIISVRLFKLFVFVQDRHIAQRMLVQGGATWADRPANLHQPWPTFFEGSVITTPYGAYWRRVRRNLVEALHPARIARFKDARTRTRDALLARLTAGAAGEPVKVRMIFRRTLFDLLTYMSLSSDLSTEVLDDIFKLQNEVFAAVTSFPYFAAFLPLTKRIFSKRWAAIEDMRRRRDDMLFPLIDARRGSLSDGKSNTDDDPPTYLDTLLAVRLPDEGDRALTNAEIATLAGEVMVAGTDTTASLLEWIMAEIVSRPDVQAKVYQEVGGLEELKEADLRGMPYLKAVVLEGLRLHPGAHIIFIHNTMTDTEVGGYMVPKDSEVNFLVADYGIDGTAWTDPGMFRPERFLEGGEGHGVDVTGSREVKMMPFGAGRRMCPGYSLATLHLEYLVGSLVKEFEWLPPVQGEQIDMTEDFDSVIVLKDPLRARLIPRTSSS